jgi:hypothetical protein
MEMHLGCVRFRDAVEWNGIVPFLELILVFGLGMKWNGTVPRNGIFPSDAEPTRPADSAGPSGMGDCLSLIN